MLAARQPGPAVNRRRMERVPLNLHGRMQTLHGTRTVRLHDLSRFGTKVEGAADNIQVGSEMILKCHQLDVFATVQWVRAGRCGIRFDAPISDAGIEALQAMSDQIAESPRD